jgi:hypothetical protein
MIQAFTASHDRHLAVPFNHQPSHAESYHLSRACSILNEKLSLPLQDVDRDPLWSCAALLGTAAFSWIYEDSPENSWPLTPSSPSDLEWLNLSENKMVIWHLTNPLRENSIFHNLFTVHFNLDRLQSHVAKDDTLSLPRGLIDLCELKEEATPDNNPYCKALYHLSPVLNVEFKQENIVQYLSFFSGMSPAFKKLMLKKDPRALLITAYWYAKVLHSVWILQRRAMLEGQAICLYLMRHHSDEYKIQELLEFPKMIFWPKARDPTKTPFFPTQTTPIFFIAGTPRLHQNHTSID